MGVVGTVSGGWGCHEFSSLWWFLPTLSPCTRCPGIRWKPSQLPKSLSSSLGIWSFLYPPVRTSKAGIKLLYEQSSTRYVSRTNLTNFRGRFMEDRTRPVSRSPWYLQNIVSVHRAVGPSLLWREERERREECVRCYSYCCAMGNSLREGPLYQQDRVS